MTGTREQVIEYMFTHDKETKFDIDIHREKRSLTANGYLWVLIQKIADVLRTTKEEVYEEMLDRYGQLLTDDDGNYLKVTLKSDIDISKLEGHFKKYKTNGKFSAYLIIKGSSEYNSKEMAVLLDGVVSECKELGIETKPQEELNSLIKEMQKNDM